MVPYLMVLFYPWKTKRENGQYFIIKLQVLYANTEMARRRARNYQWFPVEPNGYISRIKYDVNMI